MSIYPYPWTPITPALEIFPVELTQTLGKTCTQKWSLFICSRENLEMHLMSFARTQVILKTEANTLRCLCAGDTLLSCFSVARSDCCPLSLKRPGPSEAKEPGQAGSSPLGASRSRVSSRTHLTAHTLWPHHWRAARFKYQVVGSPFVQRARL